MNIGVILAGGKGERMESGTPKQFMELSGKPVIMHSVLAFERVTDIGGICIVCPDEWRNKLHAWLMEYGVFKARFFAEPGDTRSRSSYNALHAISGACEADDIVLIHDAARPLVSDEIINSGIAEAIRSGACAAAVPASDTIVVSALGKTIDKIPKREELFVIQTPQAFRYGLIMEAYEKYYSKGDASGLSDDCGVALQSGFSVRLIHGDKRNIKLTIKEDLSILEALLSL